MLFSFFLDKLAQEKKEWKSERETLKQEVEAKKQEKLRYQVNYTKKKLVKLLCDKYLIVSMFLFSV